jgi:hypothetical protein
LQPLLLLSDPEIHPQCLRAERLAQPRASA